MSIDYGVDWNAIKDFYDGYMSGVGGGARRSKIIDGKRYVRKTYKSSDPYNWWGTYDVWELAPEAIIAPALSSAGPPLMTMLPFLPDLAIKFMMVQAFKEVLRMAFPDVVAWIDQKLSETNRQRTLWPSDLQFDEQRPASVGPTLVPIPLPRFDSALNVSMAVSKMPTVAVGKLTFDTLETNAVQVGAKEFIVQTKPVEWQMLADLYDIRLYDQQEWQYKMNTEHPGWRMKLNNLFDTRTREIRANWQYRTSRRIG